MKKPSKLISIATLHKILTGVSKRKKIASCSGSFDLLHAGHVSYLKEAREKGDLLVVFLNTDASIAKYKGPSRPLVPFLERATLLDALTFVDYIIPLTELNPISLIEKLKPAVFCNGSDWGKFAIERTVVESYGGKFVIVSAKTRSLMSTTDLVARATQSQSTPTRRALFFEQTDILELLKYPNETKSLFYKATKSGWYIFTMSHNNAASNVDKNNIERAIRLLNIQSLITDTFIPRKQPGERDTSLFEQAVQKYQITLSKSWHISFSGIGTSNARCSNTKTALVRESSLKHDSTLNRPDISVSLLEELIAPLWPDTVYRQT